MMNSFKKLRLVQVSFLFIFSICLYWGSIHHDFTLDDPLVASLNSDVNSSSPSILSSFTTNLYHGTDLESHNAYLYRPLLKASMLLNKWIASDTFDPFWFHFVNLCLYGVLIVLMFFLFQFLFSSIKNIWAPFWGSLIFASFPAHTEAVCNIKHREEILALIFSISAWLMLIRKENKTWVAGILFLFALWSKESALLFFPIILFTDYYWRQFNWKKYIPLTVATSIFFLMRWNALGDASGHGNPILFFNSDENMMTRILVSSQIFWNHYILDQLFTLKLDPLFSSRELLIREGYFTGGWVALIGIIILFFSSLWGAVKKHGLIAFQILLFFVCCALTFNLIPIGTAGAYRLMFSPSVFLCAVIVLLLFQIKNSKLRNIISCFLVFYYSFHTLERSKIWANDRELFTYSANLNSGNALSHYSAGQLFEKTNQTGLKNEHFQKALELFSTLNQSIPLDERSYDAYFVVATEIAFLNLSTSPDQSLALSEKAIQLAKTLITLRKGSMDSNGASPYYVKVKALLALHRDHEAKQACVEALSIYQHEGLSKECSSLL